MRVTLVQMNVRAGDLHGNFDQAYKGISVAAQRESTVVLLPEMWTTGFTPHMHTLARDTYNQAVSFLSAAAKESKVWVLGSLPEAVGSCLYNTLYYFAPTGDLAATYRKTHLFAPMHETDYFSPGNEVKTVEMAGWQAGGMICFDLRFPELGRRLVLAGAQVVFVPAQFPHPRSEHWHVLLRARAIENQYYVVACNRVGESDGLTFFGGSTVIDPWGNVVTALDDRPDIVTVDLHRPLVEEARTRLAVLPARRPDIYGDCQPQ